MKISQIKLSRSYECTLKYDSPVKSLKQILFLIKYVCVCVCVSYHSVVSDS